MSEPPLPVVEVIISHRYDTLTDPNVVYWSIPFDINVKTSIGMPMKGGGVTAGMPLNKPML